MVKDNMQEIENLPDSLKFVSYNFLKQFVNCVQEFFDKVQDINILAFIGLGLAEDSMVL